MKKGKGFYIIAALAIVLGFAVAGFFSALANKKPVVVAARPLPVGARLTETDLDVSKVHASAVLPGAYENAEDVLGQLLSVPRLPGEQITSGTVGSQAVNAIAQTLPPDSRAVGVRVNKAQGVAGVIRPGDSVDIIGIIDTSTVMQTFGFAATKEEEAAIPDDPGTIARVVFKGAKVLLVPQTFRYEELPEETGESEGLSMVQAQSAATDEGDVVLAVPAAPITITLATLAEEEEKRPGTVGLYGDDEADSEPGGVLAGVQVSPVELLALLNEKGVIYMALVPVEAVEVDTPGVTLRELIIWLSPPKTVTEDGG